MMSLTKWKKVQVIFLLSAATVMVAHAQTFTVLADLDQSEGSFPDFARLVQGVDGNLYGTTQEGGAYNSGTVFRITLDGTLTKIYDFCSQENCGDGNTPSSIILGTDGNFYGTTVGYTLGPCGANCGTVFKITPSGELTTLYTFSGGIDGYMPYGGVVQATDGNFYGTTEFSQNGNETFYGTVFRVTPQGRLTTLYTFGTFGDQGQQSLGQQPLGGLIQAADGRLYGTTFVGGSNPDLCGYWRGCGTIYRTTLAGTLETVHNFQYTDGANPEAGLIQGVDGNLYGTTLQGGLGPCDSGCGTAFSITTLGALTTLHFFQGSYNYYDGCTTARYCLDGDNPYAPLTQGTDGSFYGTAAWGGAFGKGMIFEIMSTGSLVTLHSFRLDETEGFFIQSGILQATNGTFYGTASAGGMFNCSSGCGTVFAVNTGLGPFVAFVQAAGKVGQTAQILGQGFTGTASVSFNGIPASFTVVSDTYVTATVPSGATTGYVTVTTLSGTLTSNVPFHVLK